MSSTSEKNSKPEGTMSRRDLMRETANRVLAVAASADLAAEILNVGVLSQVLSTFDTGDGHEVHEISEAGALEILDEAERHAEQAADQAHAAVEKEYPQLSEREKNLKKVDYLGCFIFSWGIGSLLSGSHIRAAHYGMFAAVMTLKYSMSTPGEQEHLMAEFRSSAKAGMIIGGTVVLAEGIKADLDKAYEKIADRELTNTDRVAMLTMLAGTTSPVITTVGSATLCKKMALELAGGDMDKAAVLMQYISNSSGFLLFGDPPFIAVNEKYGFLKGVRWQTQAMWPMALYSLAYSAYKLNKLRAKEEAGDENHRVWASKETLRGMRANIPVLRALITASFTNASKFYSGADMWGGSEQAVEGLQFDVDAVLEEKFEGVMKLFKGEIDSSSHHEDVEGLPGDSSEEKISKKFLENVFGSLLDSESVKSDVHIQAVYRAIEDSDFDEIERLTTEMGIDTSIIAPLLYAARSIQSGRTPHDPEASEKPLTEKVWDYAHYLTNLNNVKGAIGHNLGDIVNVFPFQAGCVPFLNTAFSDIRDAVSEMLDSEAFASMVPNPEMKARFTEAIMFLLIMAFSSIADNYVACKVGLRLYPEKPEVALVPAVIGGGMSSVGNMANLALFNLEQMPLATSFIKDTLHLPIATVGLVWSQVLRNLQGSSFVFNLLFGKGAPVVKEAA